MKAVILAGGLGTRISEETHLKPKPMVEIGGRPILWHLMKLLSNHGIDEFIICLGYKGYVVKEYFANYQLHMSNVTFNLNEGSVVIHENNSENWQVTLVETGESTNTGGRVRRLMDYLQDDEKFLLTYGDGLADVDIGTLIAQHETSGKAVTVTAVQPTGRYGALEMTGDTVDRFIEKPPGDGSWINGGFFIVSRSVLDQIPGDESSWEMDILPTLASSGSLNAYRHTGFWQPMDTLREKNFLENLWQSQQAPWKNW